MSWRLPVLGLVAVLVFAAASATRSAGSEPIDRVPVDRVLLFSLPGVGWSDLEDADLPHLERFVQGAAIGDIPTSDLGVGRQNANAADAYLTIGAGTRAVAPTIDAALALDPRDSRESYGGTPAPELLERRLGRVPNGVAYLGAAGDANEDTRYGAKVGTLGDELAAAGIARAVIANTDAAEGFITDEPPPEGSFGRSAATALMDSDGVVPGGAVGRSLLVDDPDAAFGHRLDTGAVLDAFDTTWQRRVRTVTLVEASDISRASAYRAAEPGQRASLREQALADADALLGALLERVDPARDAVMILSPVSPSGAADLGMVALDAPGVPTGLLQSASTRRDGYVQLADIAPTVLTLLGETPPDVVEGRSFQVGDRSSDGRIERLVDAAAAAERRDGLMPLAITAVIVGPVALAAATLWRSWLGTWASRLVPPLAFGVLGLLPASFLAGRIPLVRDSTAGYVLGILAIAAAIAAITQRVEQRRPGLGAIVGVAAIVGLIGIDVLVGAPLQFNTVFGYSVIVAGRFTGPSNLAFALFGSAAIVLAALLVERAGRRGLGGAVVLLAAVVLINGLPMLGANNGGSLAMVPAFGLTALLLAGRRVGARELVLLGVAGGAAVLSFALIDLARPTGTQTHLARFAEDVLAGRWGDFADTLTRRWEASFGGATLAGWIMVLTILVVAGAYAVGTATGYLRPGIRLRDLHRPTVAAAAGLLVLGGVGLVANDSSFAVPGLMLVVIVPVVVLRVVRSTRPYPQTTVVGP
jgi:hypothetical protein